MQRGNPLTKQDTMTDTRYDAEKAADFLLIHTDTLKARARAGTLPGIQIGRRWKFLESGLLAYLRKFPGSKDRPADSHLRQWVAENPQLAPSPADWLVPDCAPKPPAKPRSGRKTVR